MQLGSFEAAPQAVRADVETLLAQLADAWAHGDGQAYGRLFFEDAQYVEAPGRRVRGAAAIARSHQQIFDGIFRNTRVASTTPPIIRQIAEDVVLVESSGAVLFAGESETQVPPNGLITMVIERRAGAWRIVSFQNTPTGRFRTLLFIARYILSRFRNPPRE
jgi:uncharacterized protein (TIGR02246 family)